MSNFALELDAGATLNFSNSTAVQNALKLGGRVRLLGSALKDPGDASIRRLFSCDNGTTTKFAVVLNHLFGGTFVQFQSSAAWNGDATVLDLGSIQAGLSNTTYYDLEFSFDGAATTRCTATLYDTDGTTVLQTNSTNSNSTVGDLPTAANVGQVKLGDRTTYDWFKLNDLSTTIWDAEFTEGAGTTVTESVHSASGTITGSFAWIVVPEPPDHGTVTLTPSTVSFGASGVATMTWFDALNNVLSPQPPTTWSVIGAGATINGAGTYVGVGAGTATIKGAFGSVSATATLTIARRLTFGGSFTVT